MKDFVEKDDSTGRKINYHWQESLKNGKKMISTSQKNSYPLARMSSLSQNCFLLIPIMVSTQWNSTDQKILFLLGKWRILKSRFPLYGKAASTLKNLWKIEKNGVHWQEYGSSLKNWLLPNFNNSFHLQKKTRNKTIDKKEIKTSFPCFQYVLVKWETASTGSSWLLSKKMEKLLISASPKISFH